MIWRDVIDVHAHIGYIGGRHYAAAEAVDRMDQNGIATAIICHFMTGLLDRTDFARANDYVLAGCRAFPDRLVPMCVVSPLHGDFAAAEFRRCLEAGFRGLKLHAGKHGSYPLSGPVVAQLMAEAEKAGAIVFIHSDFASRVCSPYQVVRLARECPRTTIILGHFGLDQEQCRAVPELVAETPNVLLDTSQTPDDPEAVFVLPTRVLGSERVLFGSDGPIISPEVNLRKLEVAVERLGLSLDAARAIVHDNATRLLSRSSPSSS